MFHLGQYSGNVPQSDNVALIGYDKDWLAQCQDNVTVEYQVMVLAAWFPSGAALLSHHECHCHKSLPILL